MPHRRRKPIQNHIRDLEREYTEALAAEQPWRARYYQIFYTLTGVFYLLPIGLFRSLLPASRRGQIAGGSVDREESSIQDEEDTSPKAD